MPAARCPMCHLANDERAWRCERCGYEFGQSIETLRGMLKTQLRGATIAFVVMLVLDAAILAGVVYLALEYGRVISPSFVFVGALYLTVRYGIKISVSRHSLKLIGDDAKLPKATLRANRSG